MHPSSTQLPLLFCSPGLINVENQVKGLIEAAEVNIERLTGQIRELNCMRDRERSILATLRLMVVPIGKLPTELLVEIFKFAVHTPLFHNNPINQHHPCVSMFHTDAYAVLPKVLRLSHVSPYWRQIVQSTPQLWAEGVLAVPWDVNNLSKTYLDRLQTLLARSSPFAISVSLQRSTKTTAASVLTPVARVILPTAQRWRNLHINLKDLNFFHDLNNLPPGTFNTLERLTIDGFPGDHAVTAFQSSPRLRSLSLGTIYGPESKVHLFQMPWSQLTDLTIADESLGGCRSILLQCSNLISARFQTSHDWDFPPSAVDSPFVVLPFLKALIMTFDGVTVGEIGFEAFLMPLALPSLKTLELEFDPGQHDFWPTDMFSEFQIRSPNIEQISLLYAPIDSEGLITLLRHGSALKGLDIQNSWYCVREAVFHALRYDAADPAPLAPRLQELYFKYVGKDFEEGLFEDAIRSRWWKDECPPADVVLPRVARLKKVTLWTDCPDDALSEDLKTRMQELATEGLELRLD
ncbi:hypothetical protein C8R44DRAFT_975799 [Mycena epipterygia]|nr:hypothetical protein C8R44DRAFT_975799 [Mycena epipterygia]